MVKENEVDRSEGLAVMTESRIIEGGRNPKIAGTRITVYTIWEHLQDGARPDEIAFWLGLSGEQVSAAIRYIEAHEDEVRSGYATILDRIRRGNPPEVSERIQSARERLETMVRDRRRANGREVAHEGHPGGQ